MSTTTLKTLLAKDMLANRPALARTAALLWKDVRVNRSVLAVGALFLTMPFLVLFICALCGDWSTWWHFEPLLVYTNFSRMLSTLTFALLGGYAFAAERADRSAEFLAYLPPSRLAIAASKAMLAVGAGLVLVVIHQLILLYLSLSPPGTQGLVESRHLISYLPSSILMFGVAWLCSTFSRSATLAAAGGIVASMAATFGMYFGFRHILSPEFISQYSNHINIAVGVVCFILGTIYYIFRFEP